MKNHLVRAVVFIVFGIACLVVSMLAKDKTVETWSSFALGLSFPLFVGGIISIVKYIKKPKVAA